jgi:hypothetical protein
MSGWISSVSAGVRIVTVMVVTGVLVVTDTTPAFAPSDCGQCSLASRISVIGWVLIGLVAVSLIFVVVLLVRRIRNRTTP